MVRTSSLLSFQYFIVELSPILFTSYFVIALLPRMIINPKTQTRPIWGRLMFIELFAIWVNFYELIKSNHGGHFKNPNQIITINHIVHFSGKHCDLPELCSNRIWKFSLNYFIYFTWIHKCTTNYELRTIKLKI